MKKSAIQSSYGRHYLRVGNVVPSESVLPSTIKEYNAKPWLPSNKSAAVLDIGCGYGRELLILGELGFTNLTGIEITKEHFDIARRELEGSARIAHMDAFTFLPHKKNTYDVIILFDVLEHIEKNHVIQLLSHIYKALKKDGTLVIRVPNMGNVLAAYSMYLDFTHQNGFTEFSLMQVLDAAGFRDHALVEPLTGIQTGRWNIRHPWKYLGIKRTLNTILHKFLFAIRNQQPRPTVFEMNIELYTRK